MEITRLVILIATYLLIAVQVPGLRLNRPAAALLGAVAMVTLGGLPLRAAYAAIDMDVMVFLLGVLLLAGFLELGGFFEWAAERLIARATSARALLAIVVLLSGVLSALFVNDTICLVLTPLVLAVLRPLRLRPLPYLLAIALASNVGSAMAPTGNPQNMLVAVASGLHFARFVATLAPVAIGGLLIVYAVVAWTYRTDLAIPLPTRVELPEVAFDGPLVVRALVVFVGALGCWLAGLSLPLVAITAAAILLAIARRDPADAFARVEWSLLLFFGALFVVMRGARDLTVVTDLTSAAGAQVHGAALRDATLGSAARAALSTLVSKVPAVILWLPVVPTLPRPDFVWLTIAMSSTLAGNLTLLGSMANLIVAERAEARGERIGFVQHLKVGVPVTMLTLAWGVMVVVTLAR